MTPRDLYRTCKTSAHRLETLQHYEVPGDQDRQNAFHAGQPLPPPRPGKQGDLELFAELRDAGRDVGRVHIVTWPLTPYVRYELAVYAENAAAGEQVRIADAGQHPELADVRGDFAIFDADTDDPHVILFHYGLDGLLERHEHTQDPAAITRCRDIYRKAWDLSVPLEEFAAAHAKALTR